MESWNSIVGILGLDTSWVWVLELNNWNRRTGYLQSLSLVTVRVSRVCLMNRWFVSCEVFFHCVDILGSYSRNLGSYTLHRSPLSGQDIWIQSECWEFYSLLYLKKKTFPFFYLKKKKKTFFLLKKKVVCQTVKITLTGVSGHSEVQLKFFFFNAV